MRIFIATAALAAGAQLAETHGRYASAIVIAATGAFFLADAYRLARQHPNTPTQVVRPSMVDEVRKIQRLESLIDAVAVGLLIVQPDGRVSYANRAARSLAGGEIARLSDLRGAGLGAMEVLSSLPPGGRQVVGFEDGRTMLVWCGTFKVPGAASERLLSIQSIAGELDAAQIGAWQAMTRVLAHEIMNSLTPIVSLAQNVAPLTQDSGVRSEVVDAIDTIARRSMHLMNFVERYREIAELPPVQPQQIRLSSMFGDIERLIRSQTDLTNVVLSVERTEHCVVADPDLLERALGNLVRNAIEALPEIEGGNVELSATRERERIVLQVADNGAGVPDDLLGEIFVPFFTTKAGGSGIGLFLAKQIASGHGGTLTAQRRPGGGMIFELAIPDSPTKSTHASLPK